MLRCFLVIVSFFSTLLHAGLTDPRVLAATEGDPTTAICDSVSSLTGDCVISHQDLLIAGVQPISLCRSYISGDGYGKFGGWEFFPHTKLYLYHRKPHKWTARHKYHRALVTEPNGTAAYFSCQDENPSKNFDHYLLELFNHGKGVTNTSTGHISARTYIKNAHMFRNRVADTCQLIAADGTLRTYHSANRSINSVRVYNLTSEHLPNGNRIVYTYDDRDRITEIRTHNPSKTITYAWAQFEYVPGKSENPNFTIRTSDHREVHYKFRKHHDDEDGDRHYVLKEVISPETPYEQLSYYKEEKKTKYLLKARSFPEGRAVHFTYFEQPDEETDSPLSDRVKALYGPGALAETSEPLYTFRYQLERIKIKKKKYEYPGDGATEIFDALGNKTEVRYDTEFRPRTIRSFEGSDTLSHQVTFTWDEEGKLLKKALVDAAGSTLWERILSYDQRGNVLLEDNNGYRTFFTYDALSRCIREEEETGKLTHFTYYKESDSLLSKIVCDRGKTLFREFYAYNDDGILIQTLTDDGTSFSREDLSGATFRTLVATSPKLEAPALGFPEVIEEKALDLSTGEERLLKKTVLHYSQEARILQKDLYDANGAFQCSLFYTYDPAGRLLKETNPLGETANALYDENGNKIYTRDFRGKEEKITYDLFNRPLRIEEIAGGECRITEHRYDLKSNRIATTDPHGNISTFSYNGLGQCVATHLPDGSTISAAYDPCGRQIRHTTPEGHTTLTGYDPSGKPTHILHPDGTEERCTYDTKGNLLTATDAAKTETHFTYDALGRVLTKKKIYDGALLTQETFTYQGIHLISAIDPEGYTTAYSYDLAGRKISEERAGKKITYAYDPLGRLHRTQCADLVHITERDLLDRIVAEKKTDAAGKLLAEERYTYDAAGNRTTTLQEIDGQESRDHYTYDLFGRLIRRVDPRGACTTIAYNDHFKNSSGASVLQKITTDPEEIALIETYDVRGKLVHAERRSPAGKFLGSETLTYDCDGYCLEQKSTVVSFVDGALSTRTITRTYDSRGRVETLSEASESDAPKITRYAYTPTGLLHQTVKPSGITVQKNYDPLGRLTELLTSDNRLHYRYRYNRLDHLLLMEDLIHHKTTTRTVDPHGALTFEKLDHGLFLRSEHDALGRRTELILPDNSRIRYRYDALYLREVERSGRSHRFLNFDLSGNLLLQEHSDGTRTAYSYDPAGRLTTLDSPHLALRSPELTPKGHLSAIESHIGPEKRLTRYTYDELEQILEEQGKSPHTYRYDSQYNRLQKDTTPFEVNALNQLSSPTFSYDLNGNLITQGDRLYRYDTLDRLISLEKKNQWRLSFTYDGLHRRLTRAAFLWKSGQWQRTDLLLFLYDDELEIGSATSPENILDLQILAAPSFNTPTTPIALEIQGTPLIPFHDLSYNTCALVSPATGSLLEFYQFSVFGEEEIFDGAGYKKALPLNPWRFAGKRQDPISGLISFSLRDYDPTLGRWITPDPAGPIDTLNLYAFVRNNSLSYYDPLGLDAESIKDSSYTPIHQGPLQSTPLSGNSWFKPLPQPQHVSYEHRYPEHAPSHNYVTSGIDPSDTKRIGYVNGIVTTLERSQSTSNYLSDLSGGYAVHSTYNATHGFWGDVRECHMGLYRFKCTEPVRLLHQAWDSFFNVNTPDARYLMIAHSQGAIHLRNALLTYDPERRKQIICVAIAPAGYIYKDTCASIIHYRVSPFCDFVPHFDSEGSARASMEGTIRILSCKKDADKGAHSIDNATYRNKIEEHLAGFISP